MLSAQALLTALVEEMPEVARRRRRRRIFAVLGLIVGLLGLGGAAWVFVRAALYGWATTDWERLTSATNLPPVFMLLTFVALSALVFPSSGMPFRTRTLRDAVGQGDERIVPVASSQPTPLEDSALAGAAVEFRALRRLPTSNGTQSGLLVPLLLLPMQLIVQLLSLPQALGWQDVGWFDSPLWWLTFTIPGLLVVVFLVVYFVNVTKGPRKRWDVTAGPQGLSWRGRGAPPHTAPWSAMRSFFKATYRDGTALGERTAFVVDTGDQVFDWVLGQNSKDAEYVESERLSRTIVTRTGLPLRELSPALESFALGRIAAVCVSSLPEGVAAEMAAARKRMGRSFLALVPVVLVLVLIGVGCFQARDRLQSAQQSYFAGLAPQVYASQKLFSDPLAYDDGQWPIATPSATSAVSRVFAQGTYQVTGGSGVDGDATVALTHSVYGDAAVEVTVHTIGFADAGLALRAQDNSDLIAFTVNQASGEWDLLRYQYGPTSDPSDTSILLDTGTSTAIHTESGSVNRLLVIMRGDTYLLYANNHLLDVASQQYDEPALTEGQVGVYVDDTTITGVFTNFVVHATPPRTSLSWV